MSSEEIKCQTFFLKKKKKMNKNIFKMSSTEFLSNMLSVKKIPSMYEKGSVAEPRTDKEINSQ